MTKKRPKTPKHKVVMVHKDRWRSLRVTGVWFFRLALLFLAAGVFIYNQYALSSVRKTVEELKKSLLTTKAELPIKRMLDEHAGGRLTELERIRIAKWIFSKGVEGVDPYFTLDLIRRESTFDPKARSHKGALGLMQILPSTGRWLAEREGIAWAGEETLLDPLTNVQLGTAYLEHLAQEFKGERLLRAAYQSGPTRVREKIIKGGRYARNP